MMLSPFVRRHAAHIAAPMLGALLVSYFGYHAVQGDRGLLSYLRLTREIRRAEITRDLFAGERAELEKRVALLRPRGIDPDMLEERVRVMLNLGRPDEMVIMLQRPDPAAAEALSR